ncbi:MAG: DUF4010 domain-containing protein [Pseudobdellovibrionaceae bacterium]
MIVAVILPASTIDPWKLFSPKKIATIIFALAFIQIIGSMLYHFLGVKTGALLTGFIGGLISSTATTAALAKQSQISSRNESDFSWEILIFLSATFAMLVEGMVILILGTQNTPYEIFVVFWGPILITGLGILFKSKKTLRFVANKPHANFQWKPLLKLTAFIIFALGISKFLQNYLGQSSLLVLTFLISLFEIHGSVIANIQLYNAKALDLRQLGTLISVSIFASYCSKLFLVYSMGNPVLKVKILRYSFILFIALLISWLIFYFHAVPSK